MAWSPAKFSALAVVFLLLAVVSVVLRFWARRNSRARFGADDVLIIPATLCVVGIAATMILGTQIGMMAQHQTNEYAPDGQPIYTKALANYEKCNYVLQLLPLASLGLSKTSVLIFYRRMFFMYHRFLIFNTVMMVIVACWAISFFFGTLFQCRDPRTLWTTFENARTGCIDTIQFYYAVSISGFITDLMILISPLPIIYKMNLPLKNRIAVADFTTPVFAWTMIESSLAVVGANLPLLRSLLLRNTYSSALGSWAQFRLLRSKRSTINDSLNPGPSVQLTDQSKSSQDEIARKESEQGERSMVSDRNIYPTTTISHV
ncbi:hypothetical protein UA08_01850 [Talaromyces atroroseus]|uniref:Rhodopsin domain-containing protein n=1 Tax=Talaromyces atroroseus TaxID=1441469 RepID=A0A1Q5QA17_TALAT|nr:hypothetical protein UA08_01850 [Talaromyces atroroseus]OKL62772.1 hypothetical protein UA08_01850 [Talaromyces atroroseus]